MSSDIGQLGIVEGMPAAEYHAVEACSASRLKAMRRSPAHCRHQIDNPDEDKRALIIGDACHAAVLEPKRFVNFVKAPRCDKRTKAGKLEWEVFHRSTAGQTILEPDEWDLVCAVNRAVRDTRAAERLLIGGGGRCELSAFWEDKFTGQLCKMRADRVVDLPGFGRVCVDLKTTADASPEAFARSVHRFGYHIQAAHYLIGLAAVGEPCDAFVIVAVEKDPPHCVAVYAIDDATVQQGHKERDRLIRVYADCEKSGVWPGYPETIERLNIPAWAIDDDI